MACQSEVTPPYYKRFYLTVGGILSDIFEVFFEGILPILVALVLLLVILFVCFVVCMMVAAALGYDVGMDEKKTRQEKGKFQNKEDSQGSSRRENKHNPGDAGDDGSKTGRKENQGSGKVDEKTRLRVEIDMLEGVLKARKERLRELNQD